jgi:NAD(P)-dependent dehydrogenase (short-subunit alcohol dehydrogenase family)
MNKTLLAGAAALACVAIASRWRRDKRSAKRRSTAPQTVVITGGSRGLGLELARCWGAAGARVVICARTAADLDRAVADLRRRGFIAHGYQCDVTSREQVDAFIEWVLDRWNAVDVLVNNAGIIQVGPEEEMTLADYRDAMNTHLWGPLYAIQAVLPHMRARRRGRIVNIASIGGEIGPPHLLPYSASKFALVGLSQGLCTELARDGIRVTTVCPGLMRTGSPRNARFKGQNRKEYAWFSIAGSLPFMSISSQRAARQIVRACHRGQPYLAISLPAKVAIRVNGLLPNLTTTMLRVVNWFLPSPGGVGEKTRLGAESFSAWSPSFLTVLNERAAARNNEVRPLH